MYRQFHFIYTFFNAHIIFHYANHAKIFHMNTVYIKTSVDTHTLSFPLSLSPLPFSHFIFSSLLKQQISIRSIF